MSGKVARLANRNPFLTSLLMSLSLLIAGIVWVGNYNEDQANSRAREVAAEAEARAKEVQASSVATCKAAVVAVTEDFRDEMLKLLDIIKDRFTETGRPVPAIYLALEAEVSNRQPPVAACEPKENP
jgi:hypothetical protein